MIYHRLLLGALLASGSSIFGLTINSTLSNLAGIDIYLFKNPPIHMDSLSFLMNQSSIPIAFYSFLIDNNNKIKLWEAFYQKGSLTVIINNMFLSPADQVKMCRVVFNPFTLELNNVEVEKLLGEELTEIYIVILQRTYYFNPSSQAITLYKKTVLASDMYLMTDTIDIEADGIINQNMWNALPYYMKNIYTVATGNIS